MAQINQMWSDNIVDVGVEEGGLYSNATFSNDGFKYRYTLTRIWDIEKLGVLFIMLNPSSADAKWDDPTIRRCVRFAKSWGYGRLHVVNLFAYRATNPKQLLSVNNPVGNYTDMEDAFRQMSNLSEIAVCAWGNSGMLTKMFPKIKEKYEPLEWIEKPLHYLKLSKTGTPSHPLYLQKVLTPIPYDKLSFNRSVMSTFY